MPVSKMKDGEGGDLCFAIRDPDCLYTYDQVVQILQKAQDMDFPLDAGSYLEDMTIKQLDDLVNGKFQE
jgi:hypothetical protein